jgi:hypothetical protein
VSFTLHTRRTFLAGPDSQYEDKASIRYKQEEIAYKQIALLTLALTEGNTDPGNHQFYNINKHARVKSLAKMFVLVIILKYKCQHTKSIANDSFIRKSETFGYVRRNNTVL